MKHLVPVAVLAALALASTNAQARSSYYFGFNTGPAFGTYYAPPPAPVYYAPAPVYYAPPVYPAPVAAPCFYGGYARPSFSFGYYHR